MLGLLPDERVYAVSLLIAKHRQNKPQTDTPQIIVYWGGWVIFRIGNEPPNRAVVCTDNRSIICADNQSVICIDSSIWDLFACTDHKPAICAVDRSVVCTDTKPT